MSAERGGDDRQVSSAGTAEPGSRATLLSSSAAWTSSSSSADRSARYRYPQPAVISLCIALLLAFFFPAVDAATLTQHWDFKGTPTVVTSRRRRLAATTSFTDLVGNTALATLKGTTSANTATITADGVTMAASTPTPSEGGFVELTGLPQQGGDMSIEIMVNFDVIDGTLDGALFDCGNGASQDNIALTTLDNSGDKELDFAVFAGTTEAYRRTVAPAGQSSVAADGQWYHIVVTVTSNIKYIFVNGVDKAGQNGGQGATPNVLSRSQCYIGKSNFPTDAYFSGTVSFLKIYSGAMTHEEVSDAYNQTGAAVPDYAWDFTGAAAGNDCILSQILYIDGAGSGVNDLNLHEVVLRDAFGMQLTITSGAMSTPVVSGF